MQEIAHEFLPGVAKMDDYRREQVNRLMLQYEKDMLKLCYIYLRDYDLAQEALQESFLKVYTRFGTYRGEAAEKTWLTAIVANTCKDILRSAWFRNRQLHVSLDSLPSSFPPPDETQLDLMAAIMDLPVKSREVIQMKYQHGLSNEEIARVLHVTPTAVSKRIRKPWTAACPASTPRRPCARWWTKSWRKTPRRRKGTFPSGSLCFRPPRWCARWWSSSESG